MERLTVFQTDKGRYSVRPIDWEGIWDKQGRIQESGIHHIAIFEEKEDAEFFAKTKNAEEQGKLLILPCKPGDTVYTNFSVQGWYMRKDKRPYKAIVTYVGLSENPDFNCFNVLYGEGKMWQFKFSDIGKTVFMTEQESMEALEETRK